MPNPLLGAAEPGPVLKVGAYVKNSDEVSTWCLGTHGKGLIIPLPGSVRDGSPGGWKAVREASGVEVITELGLERQIEVNLKSDRRSSGKQEEIFKSMDMCEHKVGWDSELQIFECGWHSVGSWNSSNI